MARPIMFSQTFPSYHAKAGQPTFFVEKIWKFILEHEHDDRISGKKLSDQIILKAGDIDFSTLPPKSHTIRAGNRWNENIFFSPRIWLGAPYRSRQSSIADDMQVKKIWHLQILPSEEVFIDGQAYGFYGSPEIAKLAFHDGLSADDFQKWFSKLPFEGQIICWDPDLEY